MKEAPTLADAFLRESFKPYYQNQVDPEQTGESANGAQNGNS